MGPCPWAAAGGSPAAGWRGEPGAARAVPLPGAEPPPPGLGRVPGGRSSALPAKRFAARLF